MAAANGATQATPKSGKRTKDAATGADDVDDEETPTKKPRTKAPAKVKAKAKGKTSPTMADEPHEAGEDKISKTGAEIDAQIKAEQGLDDEEDFAAGEI
jgi:hypothetical protein